MKKILAAFSAAFATAVGVIFTPDVVMWVLIILGLEVMAYVLTWGTVEQAKRLAIYPETDSIHEDLSPPEYWHTLEGKRRILKTAYSWGFVWTMFLGVVFLAFTDIGRLTDPEHLKTLAMVFALWVANASMVSVTNPRLYVFTFKYLYPLLVRKISSRGVRVDRGADGRVVAIKDGDDKTVMVGKKGDGK